MMFVPLASLLFSHLHGFGPDISQHQSWHLPVDALDSFAI
jgi:hypothetical protein